MVRSLAVLGLLGVLAAGPAGCGDGETDDGGAAGAGHGDGSGEGGSGGGSGGAANPDGAGGAGASSRGEIGAPCERDEQCTVPGDAECFAMFGGVAGIPAIPLPGGFCTKGCDMSAEDECGPVAGCVSASTSGGFGGVTLSVCTPPCASDDECRKAEGYRCNLILPGLGYCWPGG